MKFEQLDSKAVHQCAANFNMYAASGTTIETKIGVFWKTDGYDDKVPSPVKQLAY